jgi:hypothetical protein
MSYKPYVESVSNSRAFCWLKCKMLYSLKYILRLRPLPKSMHFESWQRMFRGTVLHAGFEAALLRKDYKQYIQDEIDSESAKDLTLEQREALAEIQESSLIIVENLIDWLPIADFEPVMHEGRPLVEFQLTAPLEGWPGGFNGFLDGVVRHIPSGRVCLIDWKSKQTFGAEGGEYFQVQLPLYLYALKSMGILSLNQFALIEVKSTPPKRKPKFREDSGTFDGVRVSSDGQFRWSPRSISDAEIDNNYAQFAKMALSMSRFTPEYAYMSRSEFNCKTCEYNVYCSTKLQNGDVPYILKNNYITTPASLRVLSEK